MPSGTVTFLLTDVEGSTAAWERDPHGTASAITTLDQHVGEVVTANSGVVVKSRGEGDSHFCVFTTATDAVVAGVALLRTLADCPLSVRVAVHTGEADLRDGDYYGRTVNRAARLRSAGHGGQILVSEVAAGLVREGLPEGLALRDLGVHRLKDLSSPESIYEIVHPELPQVTRPLTTLDLLRNNLPLQLTPLIGRDDAVRMVLDLLAERRLVSLVALGGTGKTRLALQVAAESAADHRGGVWYAELAPLHSPDQVAQAILDAVGGSAGTADPMAEAVDWIAARDLLLVLDNCEHLIDAVAQAVGHLLARCPGLKVLATSRQPLEVPGESVFRVPPLGLPDPRDDATMIADAPAVQLFLERGRSVSHSLEITAANAPTIGALCAQLDGLPLAIELAASRLKVLDPEQILERLSDRLALVDGARPSRANRTVTAAIEWSYDLLKPEEKALLRRLSIFEAPADFAAVEAVCGEGLEDASMALSALVDHSLVVLDTTTTGRRYRLLDLVRAFSGARLDEAGERAAIQGARAEWIDALAREALGNLRASPKWMRDFLETQPDIEAALAWRASGDAVRLTDSVLLVGAAWKEVSRWTVAASWVERALEAAHPEDAPRRLALLLLGASLAFHRWEFRDGIRKGEEALELARRLGDPLSEQKAHNFIASCTWSAGDLDRARHHNERSYDLALALPGAEFEAHTAANNLGLVALSRGDFAAAETWFSVLLGMAEKSGRRAHALWRLGSVAEGRGDFEAAESTYRAAIAEARSSESGVDLDSAEGALGGLLESIGRIEEAEAHYRAAYQAASEAGKPAAGKLLAVARVAAQQHRLGESRILVEQAFRELAGEPVSQIVIVDAAVQDAWRCGQADLAYELSRGLLEVTLRDGTAKGAAWAMYLAAEAALEVGRADEARGLVVQARARCVALGDVDIGTASAATRIEECDELLAKIDSASSVS
ncbi:MAG TPA: adenylate/guanylate cyclase domain-containing protein [Acidimicrobiales bacterium]|nr:adenylate/guanylate cyclase domain-containing protein [Acidimicrobiales bacterium]